MRNRIRQWEEHPLTKALIKILFETKETALMQAYSSELDTDRAKYIARAVMCKELLDFENLFIGENIEE